MNRGEIVHNAERLPELQIPIQKYHIVFNDKPDVWYARSGSGKRWTGQSRRFPFLNSDSFFAMNLSGAVLGRDTNIFLESPIDIGTIPTPETFKNYSYLGELMTNQEHKIHIARHEVGHMAVHHDLAVILQHLTPGQELEFLDTMSQAAARSRRKKAFPLSMLHKFGSVYNTDQKRFIEDLAEMYAVKARSFVEGSNIWERYRRLTINSNPQLESLFIVMEELFKESQKLQY